MIKTMKNAAITTLELKIADIDVKLAELGHQKDCIEEKMNNVEINPEDYADQFDEVLDSIHEDFMGRFTASQILKELDPIDYRERLINWVDSNINKSDTQEYQELAEDLEEVENQIEDLEEQRTEIEDAITDLMD